MPAALVHSPHHTHTLPNLSNRVNATHLSPSRCGHSCPGPGRARVRTGGSRAGPPAQPPRAPQRVAFNLHAPYLCEAHMSADRWSVGRPLAARCPGPGAPPAGPGPASWTHIPGTNEPRHTQSRAAGWVLCAQHKNKMKLLACPSTVLLTLTLPPHTHTPLRLLSVLPVADRSGTPRRLVQ